MCPNQGKVEVRIQLPCESLGFTVLLSLNAMYVHKRIVFPTSDSPPLEIADQA